MTKLTDVPHSFADAAGVSPEQLNDNLEHMAEQIRDVQDHRYVYSNVSLPFHRGLADGYGYQDTTPEEVRTYRFLNNDSNVSIVGATLSYYGTATDTVYVYLLDSSDGYYPSTAEPFLQVTPTSTDATHTYTQVSQVDLAEDTEYRLLMTSDGTFNSKNTWVELRFRSDRYEAGEPTAYEPNRYRSGDTLTAQEFSNEMSAIETAITSITGAQANPARFSCHVVHDIRYSDPDGMHTIAFPRVDSDTERQTISKAYSCATRGDYAATGTANMRLSIYDQTDTIQKTLAVSMLTGTNANQSYGTATEYISGSGASPTTISDDWYGVLQSITSSNNDRVAKYYVWIIYQ